MLLIEALILTTLSIPATLAVQSNPMFTTITTKKSATTTPPTPATTTPKSYFPSGPARNAIHNLHPNEEEMELLDSSRKYVETAMAEWKSSDEQIVEEWDWRKQGVVLPVNDMKKCSAAYAFSVVAILESQFKITHGELKPFSVQQLIDCCSHKGAKNFGCAGGRASTTFTCIQTLAGLQTHRDYPWEGKQGECRYSLAKVEIQVKGFFALKGEEPIRLFVWKHGPVTAYINPTLLINDYSGGIIRAHDSCDPSLSKLTHMVVIVGFGERDAVPYWIVRNSWGPRWGYAGYFHIERGTNACGIENLAFVVYLE